MIYSSLTQKPWQSGFFTVHPSLGKVPTMLSEEECRMLAWVAQYCHNGSGSICDLGAFTGGSAAHLAYGVRKSGFDKPGVVHSYDFFEIDDMRKKKYLYDKGISEFTGSNMMETVKKMLEPYAPIIEFHKGDITLETWNRGEISILFVDIAKSYDLNRHLLMEFFPQVIPGKSVVIQQDYLHFSNPWVMATMEAMEDYFELLSWTEFDSVIFGVRKAFDPKAAAQVCDSLRTPAEMSRLLRKALKRFPYVRQREAVARSILAYESNPTIEKAWQYPVPKNDPEDYALLVRG